MDIVITVVGKVAEYTVAPVLRQFGYLVYYKSNVKVLKEKVTTLIAERDGLQRRVDAAKRDLKPILPLVDNWLERVNQTIQETETCFEEGRAAKATTCCSSSTGWCPNLKVRHSLSRKAAKVTPEVVDLLTQGDFGTISCPASPRKMDYPVLPYFEDSADAPAKAHGGAVSSSGTSNPTKPPPHMDLSERPAYRLPFTKDLLKALKDDKINMIGISGTTREMDALTADEFTRAIQQRDLFEEVVLDLHLENGGLVERAEWLRGVLLASGSKRILVIMTDVWGTLDLEAIGICCVDVKKGCKIMLISQLPDVFGEMQTQSNFKLLLQSTPKGRPVEFESRTSVIRDVMNAVADDESNPVVIWGMGGIGKTTLVEEIGAKASEVDLFDEIAMVEITQQPDFSKIQGKLAIALGMEFIKEDDTLDRSNKLRKRLSDSEKRKLVILDNVWAEAEPNLWDLGISISRGHPNCCKVLITSRDQSTLQTITTKSFLLGDLPEDDAWSLFKKMIGSSIENNSELYDIAKEVLNLCGGLPVAISTVGRALQGNPPIPKWRDARRQLKRACPEDVPRVLRDVYGKIEFSYQSLSSQQDKSCFLLCCMFAKGNYMSCEELVMFGFGLNLFQGIDLISEARDCFYTSVHTLKSRSLLLKGGVDEQVSVHDVVRDVAMYIASNDQPQPKRRVAIRKGVETVELSQWRKSNDEESAYCCSLTTNMSTTELLVLAFAEKCELQSTIFDGMGDLKVLAIFDSFLPTLPPLKSLQTLILQGCSDINIDVIGELQTLMILRLGGSGVKVLPHTFKKLSNLRLLDLSKCYELEVISPGVISSLSRLEELHMDHFQEWEFWVVDKLASTETTNWISQLEVDEAYFWKELNRRAVKKLEMFNNSDQVSQLKDEDRSEAEEFDNSYQVSESEDEERRELEEFGKSDNIKSWANSVDWTDSILSELLALPCLTTLEVCLPPFEIVLGRSSKLFNKLERFKISIGWEGHESMNSEDLKSSENYLRVHDVDSSSLGGISVLLKKTKTLRLKMKNLTEPNLNCCAKLESLTLQDCDSLEYLIDMTLKQQDAPRSIFPVLNMLSITGARRLKEIFHEKEADKEFNFLALQGLYLRDLPSFSGITNSICKRRQVTSNLIVENALFSDPKVVLSVLKTLDIENLGKVESIWNSQLSPNCFSELEYLTVKSCDKLLHLVPTHMQNRLQRLKHLYVWNCSSLEEIFEVGRLTISEGNASVPSEMSQHDLGMQIDFKPSCQGFQNFAHLFVTSCNNLRYVFSPSIARGLVQLYFLRITKCEKIEEIIAADEGEETEYENLLPRLDTLNLESLPNLGSFSQGRYNFDWPRLNEIEIKECNKMNHFCLGSLSIPRETNNFSRCNVSLEKELKDSRKENPSDLDASHFAIVW